MKIVEFILNIPRPSRNAAPTEASRTSFDSPGKEGWMRIEIWKKWRLLESVMESSE